MSRPAWEYCLLTCTPLTGLDDDGVRLSYHLVAPEGAGQGELHSEDASPRWRPSGGCSTSLAPRVGSW